MTTPADTEPATPSPEWVHVDPPPEPAASRSEPTDEDRGRPLGQWVLAGGSGAALGGVGLFSAFGPIGLAAGAVVAAGGGVAYGVYRLRRTRQPGFKTTRMRTRQSRQTSRLGSVGKGRGPKLGGRGKGPLGGKGAKLGGGRGAKLGKGGKLGTGRGGKLLGGKSGKLLGAGRGSKLGGKSGLGLGKGRRSTSRLGSVGSSGRRSGGGFLGRGGKAGLGLGKRGGKLLGGKGKAGFGRWGGSTGKGAGLLGRGLGKAARKTGRAVLRTPAGKRAANGFKAAKKAMAGSSTGTRWSRFRAASKAARSKFGSPRKPFAAWAASVAAAVVALTAMAHGKWQARHTPPAADTSAPAGTTTSAPNPDAANTTATAPQRRTMSAFPLAAGAAEMNATASAYMPDGMLMIAHELDQLGEVPANVALAVRTYSTRIEASKPIHPAVVEKLQEFAKGFAKLVDLADEIGPLFRQVHADDLTRLENPRNNESEWDYSRNN